MEASHFFEQIDAYLDGTLPQSEVDALELAAASDPLLEREIKKNIILRAGLQAQGGQEVLRRQIRQWRKDTVGVPGPGAAIRTLYPRLAIAASLLILLGAVTFLWLPGRYADARIAASVYQNDVSGLKSGGDQLSAALSAFATSDYQQAAVLFGQFPDDDRALYGLGHSQYLAGQYEQAAATFSGLAARKHPVYRERAEWYAAVSRVASGEETDDLDQLLQRIITEKGYYSNLAEKVRGWRNSIWR